MQDQRSIITSKICMTLIQHGADQELIDAVRNQLEVELSKYEVQERCTAVAVVDNTPYQYLQQFLNIKRIEGNFRNEEIGGCRSHAGRRRET